MSDIDVIEEIMSQVEYEGKIISGKCPICGKISKLRKIKNEHYEEKWCERCILSLKKAKNPYANIDFLSM